MTGIVLLGVTMGCPARAQDISPDTASVPGKSVVEIKSKPSPPQRKSPMGAMVRSVVFPGWGQFYTGHPIKGGLIFCLESGLIAAAIIENGRASDIYRTDYQKYLGRIDKRNQYIWWTAGVVVYSMIDAYVDAHLFKFDEDNVDIGVAPSRDLGGAVLFLRMAIPGLQ